MFVVSAKIGSKGMNLQGFMTHNPCQCLLMSQILSFCWDFTYLFSHKYSFTNSKMFFNEYIQVNYRCLFRCPVIAPVMGCYKTKWCFSKRKRSISWNSYDTDDYRDNYRHVLILFMNSLLSTRIE